MFYSIAENEDYISGIPCQKFKFQRKLGYQKKCGYFRIIDDSLTEDEEHFSVSLKVENPYSVTGINRATVTIMDATASSTEATTTIEDTTEAESGQCISISQLFHTNLSTTKYYYELYKCY